ncbi:hypothetical protein GDA03_09550 [Salmonella enterica subsp. enterica]|nr:hypothetical protein [Salmonella enterica subsp. enterica]
MILLNSNESLGLVKIYPPNLEDNDFKAFFLALTDCKFAVCYNSLILFNFGDSPNLPATSKKAALPSHVRARFVNLPAQGWHYRKNLQVSDGVRIYNKAGGIRKRPDLPGRGNTRRKKGRQKHALSRCLSHKKAAKKDAKES